MPTYCITTLENLDRLIRIKGTGTPKELAARVKLSERALYKYIALLKDLGGPIKYSPSRRSYYYELNGSFHFRFKVSEKPPISNG